MEISRQTSPFENRFFLIWQIFNFSQLSSNLRGPYCSQFQGRFGSTPSKSLTFQGLLSSLSFRPGICWVKNQGLVAFNRVTSGKPRVAIPVITYVSLYMVQFCSPIGILQFSSGEQEPIAIVVTGFIVLPTETFLKITRVLLVSTNMGA